MKLRFDRRRFLRGSFGSLGAMIAARVGWLFPEAQQVLVQASQSGTRQTTQPPVPYELFEGFLLLHEEILEGAELPIPVKCAPAPILCQVEGPVDPALISEVVMFNSIDDFKAHIPFKAYIPAVLPRNVGFINAYEIRFAQSGSIYMAIVNFGMNNANQPLVSIWAQPVFPRPYPVWPVRSPFTPDDNPIPAEKMSFLPSPGVMRPSALGHVLQWIEQDILYTLVVEHDQSREAADRMAKSLVHL